MDSRLLTKISLGLATILIIISVWAVSADSYMRMIMQADLAQYLCQLENLPQQQPETTIWM